MRELLKNCNLVPENSRQRSVNARLTTQRMLKLVPMRLDPICCRVTCCKLVVTRIFRPHTTAFLPVTVKIYQNCGTHLEAILRKIFVHTLVSCFVWTIIQERVRQLDPTTSAQTICDRTCKSLVYQSSDVFALGNFS